MAKQTPPQGSEGENAGQVTLSLLGLAAVVVGMATLLRHWLVDPPATASTATCGGTGYRDDGTAEGRICEGCADCPAEPL